MQKVGKKLLEFDFFLGFVIFGLLLIGVYFLYVNCLLQVKVEIKDCRVVVISKVSILGIENMFEMCEMSDVYIWCIQIFEDFSNYIGKIEGNFKFISLLRKGMLDFSLVVFDLNKLVNLE